MWLLCQESYSLGIQRSVALVPLKHIDYQLEIVNSLLHVTLVQHYDNPTEFPINPEASIYKFIAQFGNAIIEDVANPTSLGPSRSASSPLTK